MPNIYVSGKFTCSIELSDKDYPYTDWVDKKLAKQREEYEKPNLSLWLEIENKDDSMSPLAIPITNQDVFEGSIKYSQNGMKFTLEFDGKAKVSVHKDTKKAIDDGEKPLATGIAINGAQHSFDQPMTQSLEISSKKI